MTISSTTTPSKSSSCFQFRETNKKPVKTYRVTSIALVAIGLLLLMISSLLLLLRVPMTMPCLVISSGCMSCGVVLVGSKIEGICFG
ncbi:hypothetical protein A6E32_00850 [Chlamydia trachomatis]|uniref:hypothetical protein n=1 Tax=Chlamydia trachomatis TaxID=813 RepID=UPI0002E164AB|nr:hypothetical protein [Chlamydia trachomatis]ANI67227.1 hypothetical protein A6E32_00850 [Chlamydia trachomatis]ATW08134.1 hypothetical protein BKC02_00850 [Chlamydia trachomatis]ATW09045.1 hypothetical protein BKC03_00850 [Chlamydia trachomatis]ATW15348.1 hypothetical protein BKB89_00850 [Chlamydia trachomatis]ATW16260.1 hypothetical protein BKB90_00850 [Chlamydia trachomatis]